MNPETAKEYGLIDEIFAKTKSLRKGWNKCRMIILAVATTPIGYCFALFVERVQDESKKNLSQGLQSYICNSSA